MRRARGTIRLAGVVSAVSLALVTVAAAGCGETRRPIGDECLRGEDCLSGVCASRVCVSAPGLVSGGGGPPPDETPRIPEGDASIDAKPSDAGTGG